MTGPRPLAVTQKQVTAILKGAARAGVRLVIIAREGEVEFVVDKPDEKQPPPPVKKRPSFDI